MTAWQRIPQTGILLAVLLAAGSVALGQSWYGLEENGLEPLYRNQGPYGTCWAFGAMASVESNIIKQGLMRRNICDLSERDMAWHSGYQSADLDPLTAGGRYQYCAAYFARGDGPVYDYQAPYWSIPNNSYSTCLAETDPYPNSTTPTPQPRASRPAAAFYVRDIEWLHTVDDIKIALLNYGAVSCYMSYGYGESYFSEDGINWIDMQTMNTIANFAINGLTIQAVPEPSSIFLLLASGLGFAVYRRVHR